MPLIPFSASSVRPDYQRHLEMNTQDSSDVLLQGEGDEIPAKRSRRFLFHRPSHGQSF
jgi:hypothetical protein